MIMLDWLSVDSLSDYDKIYEKLPDNFRRNPYTHKWIEMLKYKIGLNCSRIMLEFPYYDSEYLSSYYQYYIKKFKDYGKASCRIHFVDENEYKGYITVSPIVHYYNLSKSYLSPELLLDNDAFLMLSSFSANIYGQSLKVMAFPWMNQQRDFCMCAHIAAWSIMKFYGNEHSGYKDINIGGLVEKVPEYTNRKLPTRGMNLLQMAEIFREFGVTPLIVKKEDGEQRAFYREMLCYIESGIPLVAIMDKRAHAVAVIGHGSVDYSVLEERNGLIDSTDCIKSVIVNDDNLLPYTEVKWESKEETLSEYCLEDIDFILVPLYNRVHQEYPILYQKVMEYLRTHNLDIEEDSVVRIYLATAKTVKQQTACDDRVSDPLKKVILGLEMPKMVWCVEISRIDEYKQRMVSSRMIIDSTASPGENTPWLLVHDCKKMRFFSDNKWYEAECELAPYNMYQHNLKEVKVWD